MHTIKHLSCSIDEDFWSRAVLSRLPELSATLHSVLAVSALHRMSSTEETTSLEAVRNFAFYHYHNAIDNLIRLSEADFPQCLDDVLISCILLICFDVSHHRLHAVRLALTRIDPTWKPHGGSQSRLRRHEDTGYLARLGKVSGRQWCCSSSRTSRRSGRPADVFLQVRFPGFGLAPSNV